MSISGSCPHFRSYPNGFHDFFFAGSFSHSQCSMSAYAIRTLSYMCYSHGNKLFCFFRKCTLFKNCFTEIAECFCYFRSKSCSLFRNFSCCFGIKLIIFHVTIPFSICSFKGEPCTLFFLSS